MSVGGFVCPWCGAYNAFDEKRCHRCEQWLPPPSIARFLRAGLGEGLWATKLLGGLSVFIFALEMVSSGAKLPLLGGIGSSTLIRYGAIVSGLEWNEPYRLLSACFVHMSVLHVAMNILALASLGRMAEEFVGGPRMVLTYVITGVVGFVVSRMWGSYGLTAGASGAVFGVNGLVIASMALRRDERWKSALTQGVVFIVITSFSRLPINNAAHIGGLLCGIVLGVIFGLEKRPWRIGAVVNTMAGLSLVAIVVSLVLPQRSELWKHVRSLEESRAREPSIEPNDLASGHSMTRTTTISISALLAVLTAACGARTGLDADDFSSAGGGGTSSAQGGSGTGPVGQGGGAVGQAGRNHGGSAGGTSRPNKLDCTDASITYIYAIGMSGLMYSFNPANGAIQVLHSVSCPSSGTPFSMAVDRKGIAYVVYSDLGSLFRVSTATGACSVLPYQPGQHGFGDFGMGFSTDLGGPSETLFLAGSGCLPGQQGCTGESPHLGSLNLTSFKVTDLAAVPDGIGGVELTGTGDGRLYGFFQDPNLPFSHIVRIDKQTGAFSNDLPLPGITVGNGWAFGFWGGNFYVFTAPAGQGLITLVDPATGASQVVGAIPGGDYIVGAGVSTCAPEE